MIDQELDLLARTLGAQDPEPTPSVSVESGGLDVLQAAAAAEVAGRDRLVLIIGPAGAGTTSMLTAAIDDLRQHDRSAPPARSASRRGSRSAMPWSGSTPTIVRSPS